MNIHRTALALAGIAGLAGCDMPTEAPILEQRWVLPLETTSISVNEFLPAGVSVVGNSFSVEVATFNTLATLGSLCATCGPLQGVSAPVPAFRGTLTVSQTLPADVSAASVRSGSITVAVGNGFNFDPIAGGGSVTITLTDGAGGKQIGQAVITGSLPAGATTSREISLATGAIGSTVVATTVVDSPGGQTTTIDNGRTLTVTATPGTLLVGSATVNVASRAISIDPLDLDVEDIDDAVSDRIESGAFILDITNPFGVGLSLQTAITYPGGALTKPLSVGTAASSATTISYTGDEFRTFLGQSGVRFTGSGTVAASAGSITVTPGQQAAITAKLDLTLKIGD